MQTHHTNAARHRTPSGLVLLEMLLALTLVSTLWICVLALPRTLSALDHALLDEARWHARAHAALQSVHDDLATGSLPESVDPSRGARFVIDSNRLQIQSIRQAVTGADVPVWITYHLSESANALLRSERVGTSPPLTRTLVSNVVSWDVRSDGARLALTLIDVNGSTHTRSIATPGVATFPRTTGGTQ